MAFGVSRRALIGPPVPKRLRPPGAAGEEELLAACIRCGQCVLVCPPGALELAGLADGIASGVPFFDSRANPCDLCAGEDLLRCIESCPTPALGALGERPDPADTRIGIAVIDQDRCFAWQNTICRSCWHACPYPNAAIVLDYKSRPEIVPELCTGCGLCDRACLTEPSSIHIAPFGEGVSS